MSVPEGKRTESKLRVQTQSRELARHTMQLCSNEKIFPKRDRWILSSRIMDTALAIMENVDFANDIQAVTPVDFALRRKSQTIALASTAKMIGLIDLAYTRYGIEGSRVSYWVGLVLEVRELVKKWRQSDKTRFESLMKGRS